MEELTKMVKYAEEFGEPSMKQLNQMALFPLWFVMSMCL